MRNKFDEQLAELNMELAEMGALCEQAISCATKCLINNDSDMALQCVEIDKQIDQKESDIETLCMKLLLRQQPVARDLRLISSAMKMISDMERIGDQAADIVEIAPFISGTGIKKKTHIAEMAKATIGMVTDSIESFVKSDSSLARRAIKYDDIVDNLFDEIKSELIEAIADKKNDAEALIDLLMVAKYFERIGDHAENIAEWVIYASC